MIDVTVVVPFYRRHEHLEKTLAALAAQRGASYEVVIATPECDRALERLCAPHRFARIEPYDASEWNVSQCRNAGIRAARGEVLLFLDADLIASPDLVALHRDAHRSPRVLAAGRVLGFQPYAEPIDDLESDPRWTLTTDAPLPWAFCWSGNLSIRCDSPPLFDESFRGWGAEDLEFSYRAVQLGCDVRFLPDAWAIHQPHERAARNVQDEQANFRRFLRAHPAFEVEIVVWLNDLDANRRFREIANAIAAARGIARAASDGTTLRLGAHVARDGERTLPILGVATPFDGRAFERVEIAEWMSALPADVCEAIAREAQRVGGRA